MEDFRLAVVQMMVTDNKQKNIQKAAYMIKDAADNGAKMVVLPEIFNSPYANNCFEKYAELYPGETSLKMMRLAKKFGIVLIAGSIPEKDGDRIFNTSYIYDESGELIGRHRKMHLFDINIDGGQYFKESDILTPGDETTVVDTSLGRIGIGICYDVRFPELFRNMALRGAELILLPAAFNMTTGPKHWDISMRVRALDNQVYLAAASPARDMYAGYISYANSMIVDPWGEVIVHAGINEEVIYADIEGKKIVEVREQLPLLKHRRPSLYRLK